MLCIRDRRHSKSGLFKGSVFQHSIMILNLFERKIIIMMMMIIIIIIIIIIIRVYCEYTLS